ncbi:Pfam:DUF1696 [Seminavis robusta]|uniref:Pfam:DUF1696 n=1 Tax=Seminavis robusta TaxID=568900 RepID=A0A9N8DED6_9STRA|nr:Pfam:DUF1696 [Seminavis robusta]|eukprot:Sro55_g032550.1 Pfam:DUF1696 (807) ;mRNA; f:143674-146516
MPSKIHDFVFNNAHQQDSAEAEKAVREKYPLLLGKDEKIVLAFKGRGGVGRDKSYFTTDRIIIKDGKGVSGKRKQYQSIPWWSMEAFSTDTAGKFDGDVSVRIYSRGIDYVEIDLAADNVNIYEVQQFLSEKLLAVKHTGIDVQVDTTPPDLKKQESSAGSIIGWFGDNAKQTDPKEAESTLKIQMPILLKNETVQIGFQAGQDYIVFTDLRVLRVDVEGAFEGVSDKKVGFFSIRWDIIKAFSVQTAGAFLDSDMEMCLYTNLRGVGRIAQDLHHGKADLFALQKILCNHILGEDAAPVKEVDTHEGEVNEKGFWWFHDNQRPLDTVEMNKVYHSAPAILRGNETVEMAFKGHRDITLFTNLRVILIDPKGLTGKKTEYTSLCWDSITAHGVRTAGKRADTDCEVLFWTEMDFYAGRAPVQDDNPVPPRPAQSFFEIDFNKNRVDMTALNYYLSQRLVAKKKPMRQGVPIPMDTSKLQLEKPEMELEALLQKVGGDQREIDPKAIDEEFHSSTKILLDGEHVLMAFKAGRDISCFTSHRVLLIDVQGPSGKKVEYRSIPFSSIRAWCCETAGVWDTDTELTLYTRNGWDLAKIDLDFRTGKADISRINRFLAALIIGLPSDSKVDFGAHSASSSETKPIKGATPGILDNCWEIDAAEIDKKLRSDPLLLLDEEKVLRAFQRGRDVTAYTDRRMISIDTKGLSSKRVKYKSVPFHQVYAYEFETCGLIDRDAEIYLHTEISDVTQEECPRKVKGLTTKQSLLVAKIDIYGIGNFFNDQVLFNKKRHLAEPDGLQVNFIECFSNLGV